MAEEFVPGNPRAKLIFLGLLFIGITLLFFINPLFEFLDAKSQALAEKDPASALQQSLNQLLVVVIALFVAMWAVAAYFFRLGLRVKKFGQWPPPGMRMPFRTKVRRDTYAKVTWILLLISAGLVFLNPFVKFYAWYTLSQLSKELNSPNKPLKKDLGEASRPSAS